MRIAARFWGGLTTGRTQRLMAAESLMRRPGHSQMRLPAGCRRSMNKQLGDIRHVALDMDGTICSGGTLFESTLPFLAVLRELGIGSTFLMNNSSKSAEDYLAGLRETGIPATPDQLCTSMKLVVSGLAEFGERLRAAQQEGGSK
jgi:Haloacid dehalogenase-like hydrolase